jgi:hypothetical protein
MGFTYVDAAKLMGNHDSPLLEALDRLTGGMLLAASTVNPWFVLNLFEAKSELVRLSSELAREIGERRHGLDRYERSKRFAAAHAVVGLAAFFEVLAEAELPVPARALAFTKAEQLELRGNGETKPSKALGALVEGLLKAEVPMPSPQQPMETTLEAMRVFYLGLASEVASFVMKRPAVQKLDEADRQRFTVMIFDDVPKRAVTRYDERFQQMAMQFPEVAFWSNRVDHQATRAEVKQLRREMYDIKEMLAELKPGAAPGETRLALAGAYENVIEWPVLAAGDQPQALGLPKLRDSYVPPCFRSVEATGTNAQRLSDESWWEEQAVHDDLVSFLFGYLVSEPKMRTRTPFVVLGQPGSGKSVLTQMLAALLPPDRFLTVRVPLRKVAGDADLQTQIERAVRDASGYNATWPELVHSAPGVLPVVLLDGFDELLQVTGVSQTDYLDRVAEFQRRESAVGRPVIIMITSRTAVADRAAVPPGTVVIRLEPFREPQIRQWLELWNRRDSGLPALQPEMVLQYPELASQPLLLIMLALYYADEGRARRATTEDAEGKQDNDSAVVLDEAALYERLLVAFAKREVDKSEAGLPHHEVDIRVNNELFRLSIVAVAMFARGRYWVSEEELDNDLRVLLGPATGQAQPRGFRSPLTAAQIAFGRFFFIHNAQVEVDKTELSSYEFLHATFGEYLIARLVTKELLELSEIARQSAGRTRQQAINDSFLHALLSYMPLTARRSVVTFIAGRLRALEARDREQIHQVMLNLHGAALEDRRDITYERYSPQRLLVTERYAAYSANLVVLAMLSADNVEGSSLFGGPDPVAEWSRRALLWRSQLVQEGWRGLLDVIAVDRIWTQREVDGQDTVARDVVLRYDTEPGQRTGEFDPYWSYNRTDTVEYREAGREFGWSHNNDGSLWGQAWFSCNQDDDTLMHALVPYRGELHGSIASFHSYWPGTSRTVSTANALTTLLLQSTRASSPEQLAAAYDDCLEIIIRARFGSDTEAIRQSTRRLVLLKLATDQGRVPPDWLAAAMRRIRESVTKDTSEVYAPEELARIARDTLPGLMGTDAIEM